MTREPQRVRCSRLRRRLTGDRGEASLISILIVAPVLMFFLYGTTQYWLYALAADEIEIAATEGARRAALANATFADGVAYAKWFVSEGDTIDGDVTVTGLRGPTETTLTVTGQCRWLISVDLFGDCTITRTAVLATERFESGLLP
jgi:Flp pilus assembly protein TadG